MTQSPAIPPTEGDEERDDAVIGVAFRYSALALLGLLLIGGGAWAVKYWQIGRAHV